MWKKGIISVVITTILVLSTYSISIIYKVEGTNSSMVDDNILPTIHIISPLENSTLSGIVTVTGTANDSDGVVDHVEVGIDRGPWYAATGTTNWTYMWDTTLENDGEHRVSAQSYDGSNYSTATYIEVLVNNTPVNTPPVINITYPSSGDVVAGLTTITGVAFDGDNDPLDISVRIDEGDWLPVALFMAPPYISWSYQWNTSQMSDGNHTITVQAYDGHEYNDPFSPMTVTVDNTGVTIIALLPGIQDIDPGDTFTVNITVFPHQPIWAIQCNLLFNSTLLHVQDVSLGNLFEGYNTYSNPGIPIDNTNGTIRDIFTYILPPGDGVSRSGTAFTITFTSRGVPGVALLELSQVLVVDNDGSISIQIENGSVTIIEKPSIVYVDDDYTPATPGWGVYRFDSIQDGINAIAVNGTVFVYNGTYYENLVVNKTVSLIGENKNNTIIDGSSGQHIVILAADNCTFNGFSVRCENESWSCMKIISNNNRIENNDFSNYNHNGIRMDYSHNNIVADNIINNNWEAGIYLEYCHNNIIENNIINNHIPNHGICFQSSTNNMVINNLINRNRNGISLSDSCWDNIIMGNTISRNTEVGIFSLRNNTFYHNNLIDNTNNAYGRNANIWYSITLLEGNYWSDYTGDDSDGDGIGDTPYNITGDNNQDLYPLMHPYSPFSNVYFQGLEPLYTTEHIEIAITITPKEAIAGAQFDMSFDPSMISIEWVAEGDLFSEYDTHFEGGVIDNINGTLKNVVSLITTPGGSTSDQGSIVVMSIRAKTIPGETPLNLSNVIVGGPEGTSIDVTIINTTVTIYPHDRWDVNWDDRVNILDLIIIGQWWCETGSPCWVFADVNCDSMVNILDMILVGQHWTG